MNFSSTQFYIQEFQRNKEKNELIYVQVKDMY